MVVAIMRSSTLLLLLWPAASLNGIDTRGGGKEEGGKSEAALAEESVVVGCGLQYHLKRAWIFFVRPPRQRYSNDCFF